MNEPKWTYEKLDEKGKIKHCPQNDFDGKITGHIVIGVKQWFDENPAERIRLGWIKHIYADRKSVEYNKQTQYLIKSQRQVDEYTIEDVYHVLDKTEEQMLFEDMLHVANGEDSIVWYGEDE